METEGFIIQHESNEDCENRILKILQLRKQSLVKFSWDDIEFRIDRFRLVMMIKLFKKKILFEL